VLTRSRNFSHEKSNVLLEPAVGREVVAQRVGMEPLVEVLVGPDRAVAARGEPLPAEGDEAGRHHGARLGVVVASSIAGQKIV